MSVPKGRERLRIMVLAMTMYPPLVPVLMILWSLPLK